MNFLSSYGTKVWNMTDVKTYPACLGKDECVKLDARKQNPKDYHACFQYFCYPWQEVALTADEATKPQKKPLFKGCRNSKDCPSVKGKKGHCFRYIQHKHTHTHSTSFVQLTKFYHL